MIIRMEKRKAPAQLSRAKKKVKKEEDLCLNLDVNHIERPVKQTKTKSLTNSFLVLVTHPNSRPKKKVKKEKDLCLNLDVNHIERPEKQTKTKSSLVEVTHSDSEKAIALKEWLSYRHKFFVYKGSVKQAISKWDNPYKVLVLEVLKEFWTQKVSDVSLIEELYANFISNLMEESVTVDGVCYSDLTLIKKDKRSAVYSGNMLVASSHPKNVITKAYPTIIRNPDEREMKICDSLHANKLNVPQIYYSFETTHYTCFAMEKLECTLADLLQTNGGGIEIVCSVLKSCIPILKSLHIDHRVLYVDFSVSNIMFRRELNHHLCACMIDFGSLHELCAYVRPRSQTVRYCSPNVLSGDKVLSPMDDFEGLGFVLMETMVGIKNSPLNIEPTVESKILLREEASQGKHGKFFVDYYSILKQHGADVYACLAGLADTYKFNETSS